MLRRPRRPVSAVLAAAALAALPAPADAAPQTLLETTVTATGARTAACQAGPAAGGDGVVTRRVTMPALGLLTARLDGATGDWDLAVYDAATRRVIGASAAPDARELAQGFAFAGREVLVQACRRDSGGARARLRVSVTRIATGTPAYALKLVEVATPTLADANRVAALGLDMTEHGTDGHREVVLHSAQEEARLRATGLPVRVAIADLVARARENAAQTLRFRATTRASALPSGRTDYRRLADYESEMKLLAQQHPGLVRLVELPHRSLEGRLVLGLEIARDVNVDDGRPTFVQFGVHHAREWPSGEHVMEYAHDLVRGTGSDPRITRLVETTRTLLVPIVNPDGFNLSREAPVDLGQLAALGNLPEQVNQQLPIEDPAYIAALLADQSAGTYAYKRRNCRVEDGATPAEGECAQASSRTLGVDPNRNYAAFWGGPGADFSPTSDIYRGAAPFSEPETQNVRELVATRQATALITNHTFSNLILRPPGVRAQGAPPDEAALKALSDAMAAQNGYASIPGYQLYDTTGTTEDWSYAATGGYGYTFEIGSEQFHPPYDQVVGEYAGAGAFAGKGNRAAYLLAHETAADAAHHAVLTGTVPKGTTLRLRKEFVTPTSPVLQDAEGTTAPPINVPDRLDDTLAVTAGGRFTWHVNPSTRPSVARERRTSEVADQPAREQDISSSTPVLPGAPKLVRFQVPADAGRQVRVSISSPVPVDDYDLYVYEDEVRPENLVGSSASAESEEVVVLDTPAAGRTYVAEIRNFAAIGPVDGKIAFFAAKPGTETVVPAQRESYTLTCERPAGRVLATAKVTVDRGRRADLGRVCERARAAGRSRLRLSVAVTRAPLARALRRGLRARIGCSARCSAPRVRLTLDGRTARRLGLSTAGRTTIVARTSRARTFTGRRTLTLRFTPAARRALGRVRPRSVVRFTVVASATDAARRPVTRATRLALRR